MVPRYQQIGVCPLWLKDRVLRVSDVDRFLIRRCACQRLGLCHRKTRFSFGQPPRQHKKLPRISLESVPCSGEATCARFIVVLLQLFFSDVMITARLINDRNPRCPLSVVNVTLLQHRVRPLTAAVSQSQFEPAGRKCCRS